LGRIGNVLKNPAEVSSIKATLLKMKVIRTHFMKFISVLFERLPCEIFLSGFQLTLVKINPCYVCFREATKKNFCLGSNSTADFKNLLSSTEVDVLENRVFREFGLGPKAGLFFFRKTVKVRKIRFVAHIPPV